METARQLGEAKRILEGVEATALSSVAQVLAEVTESLARTAKDLTDMRAAEWMTAEQAAKHLGCESVKAFEKIASREGIPKHYLSARVPRYNRVDSTRGSQDAEATEGVLSALLTAGLRFLQPHLYGESALTAPPLRSRFLSHRVVPRG